MKIDIQSVKKILDLTLSRELEWYRFEGVPCVNCDYQSKSFILCKYNEFDTLRRIVISLTITDDWGNINEERNFFERDGEIFSVLCTLYDKVNDSARVEQS